MRSDNLKFNDIFWNTLGSVTYAAISLLISVVIINISGKIEGGIFSFGMSTLAHLVYIVSYFGIRPMHIVDIKYRYSFIDYRNFGVKATFIAILAGFIYIIVLYANGNYTMAKALLLSVLVIHGAIDGFADYYECEYQRVNKLYMCGQSLFFRIVIFTVSLIITLLITNNLLLAEIVALALELISFYILNIYRSKDVFKSAKLQDKNTNHLNLFLESLPLFLIVFFDMYIFTSSKFSIDVNLGDTQSGFFNLVFMPTNIIYLVMNLFMKPLLTPLSNAYYTDKKDYYKIITKTLFIALAISVVFVVGAVLFGDIYLFLLTAITGNVYSEYADIAKKILLIVIVGGCFYTLNTPLYFSLIIEKKQKYLCIVYLVSCIIAFFVSKTFVMNLALVGAALAFAVNMFILCIGVIITKALTL